MPFAQDPGGVALRPQQVGQRLLVDVQAVLRLARAPVGRDHPFQPVTLLVAPRQQRRAGRGADRAGRVAVGEAGAVAGQGVDIGRGDVLGAVGTHVAIAQVVDQDHDDIGFRRSGGRPGRRSFRRKPMPRNSPASRLGVQRAASSRSVSFDIFDSLLIVGQRPSGERGRALFCQDFHWLGSVSPLLAPDPSGAFPSPSRSLFCRPRSPGSTVPVDYLGTH